MTINEVSKLYGLSADTLRYYEKIGLIPPVKRSSGKRNYSKEDCKWVQFIRCMRNAGLPIEALCEYVNLFRLGNHTFFERKAILVQQKLLLEERIKNEQAVLKRLEHKISRYEEESLLEESLREYY